MNKKNFKKILEIEAPDSDTTVVTFSEHENKNYALVSVFNENFEANFSVDLEENYSHHKFTTYNFNQLKKILNETKIKGVSLVFNGNILYEKVGENTTQHQLSFTLEPSNIDNITVVNVAKIVNPGDIDESLSANYKIRCKLGLYKELGMSSIYQDEDKKLHILNTNGYSIYDVDIQLNNALLSCSYHCHSLYIKNLRVLSGESSINVGFVELNEAGGLYFFNKTGESSMFIKLFPSKMIFKEKLAIPRIVVSDEGIDFDIKQVQPFIKQEKERLDSKNKESYAINIIVKDNEVYVSNTNTHIKTKLPDLQVNYYDLAAFTKGIDKFKILQNDELTLFKGTHTKLITKR